MLNQIEFAMFKARGFGPIVVRRLSPRDVTATAVKETPDGPAIASAIGRNEEDATRKLIAVVTRP